MMELDELCSLFADLAPGGCHPQICRKSPLPDSYIVLTSVDDRPGIYAGDSDEADDTLLRLSWYDRAGNRGHKKKLIEKIREIGGVVTSTFPSYDSTTKHYVIHQEFLFNGEEYNGI